MDAIIRATLSGCRLGRPTTFAGLNVFPLLSADQEKPASYLTLDEALAAGSARVTDVSEGGSVPEVCFRNEGHRPVFLLDGEELVGAKQNRVVNISVLAPLASVLHIPVTCVEQGRWHASSCQMASSEQTLFAQARARKAAQVTASLERDAGAFSDQGTVWADIRGKADRLGSSSATWAMADVYRDQEARMSEYVRSFRDEPRQIGAVYRVGRNLGLELFDSPRTFATPAISRPPRGSGRP